MDGVSQEKTLLGQLARDYIRSCLSAGHTIVAEQAALPLESGHVWAFLPAGFTDGLSANPEWSLSFTSPDYADKGNADEMFARFILGYLQGGLGRYAIFQDFNV